MDYIVYSLYNPAKLIKDRLKEKYNIEVRIVNNTMHLTPQDRIVIRYGNTEPAICKDISPNSSSFIMDVKKFALKIAGKIDDIEYFSPLFYRAGPTENDYPLLIRQTLVGYGGDGIIPISNQKEFEENWSHIYYWTKYYPVREEYRVHVLDGKIARIFRKEPNEESEFKILHNENSHFVLCNPAFFPKLNKIIPELHLEGRFVGLDVGYLGDKRFIIFEYNTAPGLNNPQTLEVYVDFFREKIWSTSLDKIISLPS